MTGTCQSKETFSLTACTGFPAHVLCRLAELQKPAATAFAAPQSSVGNRSFTCSFGKAAALVPAAPQDAMMPERPHTISDGMPHAASSSDIMVFTVYCIAFTSD